MGEGMEKLKANIQLVAAAVLAGILLLFVLQNLARVEVNVLFWSFESWRFLVIGFSFAIGFAVGWLVRAHRDRRAAQ